MLIDGFDRLCAQFKGDPLVFFRNEKTLFLKIWVESTLGFVVRVRNVITRLRSFSSNLTNSRHNQLNFSPSEKGLQISLKHPQLSNSVIGFLGILLR
jgi:hypothetical protein